MFMHDQWLAFKYALYYLEDEIDKHEKYLWEHEQYNHLTEKTKAGLEKRLGELWAEYERLSSYMTPDFDKSEKGGTCDE